MVLPLSLSHILVIYFLHSFSLFFDIFFQTLSTCATCSVEEVASTGPGIRFFQLYVSIHMTFCPRVMFLQFSLLFFFGLNWFIVFLLIYFKVYKDRNVVRQLVERAEEAGFKAIALTVDTPRFGRREADIKNR